MPRARNIKPGFFESEQVGALPIPARLLFIALWQLADRDGRLVERPLQIRAYAFRYDSATVEDVSGWLVAMEEAKLIERYEAEGQKLIEIPNFAKHQRPHVKEPQSVLPAACGKQPELFRAQGPYMGVEPEINRASTEKVRALVSSMGVEPEKVRADGPYMGVEPALNVECGMLNEECGKGNGALTPAPPPPETRQLTIVDSGPDPDELFQTAAKFACEHLPAGGDVGMTLAAMRMQFQNSGPKYDWSAAAFCLAYTAAVRKWRIAYDTNADLKPKEAQWWTRDGKHDQTPSLARAPRRFGPVDLKAGLEVEDAL